MHVVTHMNTGNTVHAPYHSSMDALGKPLSPLPGGVSVGTVCFSGTLAQTRTVSGSLLPRGLTQERDVTVDKCLRMRPAQF